MPANQTHGFDLVLELAEEKVEEILATLFESEDLACALVDDYASTGVGGTLGDCDEFTLTVDFDRPTDVALPPGARNPVDVVLRTGDASAGTRTRMVVGFDSTTVTLPDGSARETVQLNFRDELYFAEATVTVLGQEQPLPGDAAASVRRTIPPLVVLSVPVDPASTDPATVVAATPFVVDDRVSSLDRDALAAGLTGGGGSSGDPTAFVQSFVPQGSTAALGIAWDWLCRVIDPRIADALGVPRDRIRGCRLTEPTAITVEDETVTLTELTLTLSDDEISLVAKIADSGFCWSVDGTILATVRIGVENGQVVVQPTVGEPDVDVDVPWQCWLVAVGLIVAGAGLALVSVVAAVIAAVVGLVVLIVLVVVHVVMEGAIGSVADAIAAALGGALGGSEGVSIPVAELEFDLVDAVIDDITLAFDVLVGSGAAVRGEGDLYVPNGHAVDLDTGAVGPADLVGGDLLWAGTGRGRQLSTLCAAEAARSGRTDIDDVGPYVVRRLQYDAPVTLPMPDLFLVFGIGFAEIVVPTLQVVGVRTTEDRFAAVQAIALTDDYVVLRYRTFERKRVPTAEIVGGFACLPDRLAPVAPTARPGGDGVTRPPRPARRPAVAAPRMAPGAPARALERPSRLAAVPGTPPPRIALGRWIGELDLFGRRSAVFRVVGTGLAKPVAVEWAVDGTALTTPSGTVAAGGGTVSWGAADTEAIGISVDTDEDQLDFVLEATVVDAASRRVRATRCIHWARSCSYRTAGLPTLGSYAAAWREKVGLDLVLLGAEAPRR